MSYGAKQYKNTSILTANPGKILIMLYEAAIKNVKKAAICMDKGDMSGKGVAIGKAHDIINELNSSLNHKVGGKIAADLEGLYNFMIEKLLKANLENNKAHLDDITSVLNNLLEGWRGAVSQSMRENRVSSKV